MAAFVFCAVQLFFAKVLRSANEDEVRHLFNSFGRVIEVNLFRAFQVGHHMTQAVLQQAGSLCRDCATP